MPGPHLAHPAGHVGSALRLALLALVAFAALAVLVPSPAGGVELNRPTKIVCRNDGNADVDSSVRVAWTDTSEDESGYEVHRSEDGGGFSKVADLDEDAGSYTDGDVSGDTVYRYKVRAVDDGDAGTFSDACRRPRQLDTDAGNFRMYYRPYPVADAPAKDGKQMRVPSTTADGDNEYAARVGGLLEGTRSALMGLGFDDFAFHDGDKPVPADLRWCDGGGCAGTRGWGSGGTKGIGLAPEHMAPYDPSTGNNARSVAITLHEGFHLQQYQYGGLHDDPAANWVWEGQARSIQDKVCVDAGDSCISLDAGQNGFADYIGQVNWYLSNVNRDLTRSSYSAALFWTYLLEQHGDLDQEPQLGMDLMADFWERARDQRDDTGIGTINRTLDERGESDRFDDVFRDFVVANYAKDLDPASVPDAFRYADEAQTHPDGSTTPYDAVDLDADQPLAVGGQIGPNLTDVRSWGARYLQLRPAAGVETLQVEARQDDAANAAFHALLAVRDGELVAQHRGTGADFTRTIDNDDYDRVVLIVAGLERHSNFRWSVNASEPTMDVVDPVSGRAAQAGDPSDPDKFLTKVDVLNPDGTPVAGIAPESFTVTVGGEPVTDDDVVSRSFLQGQYWLLLRAPQQPGGAGTYDLTVEVMGLSDTEVDAVAYGPRSEVDSGIVIDRSGSMGNDDKLVSAQTAANLYVDTWTDSDAAGLVSFNAGATVDEPLDPLDSAQREELLGAIDDLSSGGQTAIGEGALTALDQLTERGDPDHDWAIVALSDGIETADDARDIGDFLDTWEQRDDDGDANPRVHAVALGPDADRAAMQRLASETGGSYQFASLPDDATAAGSAAVAAAGEPDALPLRLPAIYRVISEEVAGEQQVFAGSGSVAGGSTETFQVDGGAEELTVAVSVESPVLSYSATLTDPDGATHAPTPRGSSNTFWRLDAPVAGQWTLDIGPGGCQEFCAETYQADAAVTSRLTMEGYLGLAPEDRQAGRAMPILVSLSDTGPITGADVDVRVTAPDGSASTLTLLDDGAHGDGEADDGFYGGTYRSTHQEGDYVAVISAEGASGAFGAFDRRARTSFGMTAGDDSDGDGLPDWWEEEVGTDPGSPDASDDPDGDGLPTLEEWDTGTLPLDPDTDGGGEADGTDPDPLDPGDDRLPTPDAVAYPGVGEVIVRYAHSDAYDGVRVRRAPDEAGPFTTIADGEPATGEHTDGGATNDTRSCYRIIGLAGEAESAPSAVTCATPRTDPIPPEGSVLIDGGAPATDDPGVALDLAATDNPEPHTAHDGDAPRPGDAEESGVADMRLSNDPDFSGDPWEPYAPTRDWTLPGEPGTATVYVQYRDGAGNTSEPAHASIELVGDGDGGDGPVARHEGPTRVETAVDISRSSGDAADTVVLARLDEYADALAGAPLATHLDAPVLLTGGDELHPATADEIERLGADEAVLLGGPAALSLAVADDLDDLGVTTRRVGGSDRFDTARLIAEELPDADEVHVAEGVHADPARGWPDALSAAGAAAGQRSPVLLVARDVLPPATAQALSPDQDVAIVGGTAAVSEAVAAAVDDRAGAVRRLAGATRYDTATEVADDALDAGANPSTTWVATGRDWPDALVSAAATGRADGALMLVDGQSLDLSPASRDWIADHAAAIDALRLAGGTAAISDAVYTALADLLGP